MIVQPDFCEHWKTRRLVELTSDESAPMAVLRLWAHCQHSRRSIFPDMTRTQLASICHWGSRKPACHVALVRSGFVEKLKGKGFAAHQWDQHNAQLLQKWFAGQKGGRPPENEDPGKTEGSEKPTDNRPLTGTKPDPIDQTRSDRPDQIRLIDKREEMGGTGGTPAARAPMDSKCESAGPVGLDGLVSGIASRVTTNVSAPTEAEVQSYFSVLFEGATAYVKPFLKAMEKQHWLDQEGKPITNWRAMAKKYASKAELSRRGKTSAARSVAPDYSKGF